MIGVFEKALCRKTASTFQYAGRCGYSPYQFADMWYNSKTAQGLYGYDFNAIAQSYMYQLNSFELEYAIPHETKELNPKYPDIMYWAGYFITYWLYQDEITWKHLNSKYDIKRAMESYDTLHTMSVEGCIRAIKEDFCRIDMVLNVTRHVSNVGVID